MNSRSPSTSREGNSLKIKETERVTETCSLVLFRLSNHSCGLGLKQTLPLAGNTPVLRPESTGVFFFAPFPPNGVSCHSDAVVNLVC